MVNKQVITDDIVRIDTMKDSNARGSSLHPLFLKALDRPLHYKVPHELFKICNAAHVNDVLRDGSYNEDIPTSEESHSDQKMIIILFTTLWRQLSATSSDVSLFSNH